MTRLSSHFIVTVYREMADPFHAHGPGWGVRSCWHTVVGVVMTGWVMMMANGDANNEPTYESTVDR